MQIEHVGAAASAARYIYMLHGEPAERATTTTISTHLRLHLHTSASAEKGEILIFGWTKGVTDQFLSLRKYQGKMVQLKFQSHQSLFDNSVSIKQQHSLMFLLFSSFPLNNSLQSPEGFFFFVEWRNLVVRIADL
jgi:hypothetical protein